MDLGAYAQIEQLEQLLTANHIEIPRLRGLRLMSEEEPFSEEDIYKKYEDVICAALNTKD